MESPIRLRILIADDEPNIRRTLTYALKADGHSVAAAGSGGETLERVSRQVFDLVLLDLVLGDANGLDLLPQLRQQAPWMRVVVITAYASVDVAVRAMQAGAFDFLTKPFKPEEVAAVCRRVAEVRSLERHLERRGDDSVEEDLFSLTETESPAMAQVLETARRAAPSEATILIRGESGTGKSLLARAIARWSARGADLFATVSCPALPGELLESELFGHVRGAFTGAVRNQPGRVAACEGGTLFLDEIGDLPTSLQPKLLRLLQEREYERVGDPTTLKADVRVLAATSADLEVKVGQGLFREDLFYRLKVIEITMLPLRERREDIPRLARDLLARYFRRLGRPPLELTDAAVRSLGECSWPGNIRELRNTLERAAILAAGTRIDVADLFPGPAGLKSQPHRPGSRATLQELEAAHIRAVLQATSSLKEAARILGIAPSTLFRKRRVLGL